MIALVASGELYLCYVGHSMEYSWEFYWVGRFYNVRSGGFNMWGERLVDDLSSAMGPMV